MERDIYARKPRYVEAFSGKLIFNETSLRIAIKKKANANEPYMLVALTRHSVWALYAICHDEQLPSFRCNLYELFNSTTEYTAIIQCELFGYLAFPDKYASRVIDAYARYLAYNDYWYQMNILKGGEYVEHAYDKVMEKLWKMEDEGKLPTIYDVLMRGTK